jgi:hypothetical protein
MALSLSRGILNLSVDLGWATNSPDFRPLRDSPRIGERMDSAPEGTVELIRHDG